MDSMKFAGIVALGMAIGLILALPEQERTGMGVAAFFSILFTAGIAGWAYACARSAVRLLRDLRASRRY